MNKLCWIKRTNGEIDPPGGYVFGWYGPGRYLTDWTGEIPDRSEGNLYLYISVCANVR